ncbi:MAG TPA: C45 family peptidase, partial [Streptosporangiaceae bacterium]|nr:C45 family peptidase [Streptosporangiaceae bacterium]
NVNREIPLLRVSGSYRAVGQQIGEACTDTLHRAVDLERAGIPRHGHTVDQLLEDADRCRAATQQAFPWLLEELDGAAEGAGIDPQLLFAASVEELWEERPSEPGRTEGRCTDVLVAPEATSTGNLLVAHNNDLSASSENDVIAIERDVPGDVLIFSIGIGPWISVGWNSAGLSLTGNEVSPNDERCGIPRLLLVRAQLRARTLAEAVDLALHPMRASAYNTVLADARGEAVNVEASAADHECWGPDGRGAIIHTNHYVSGRMTRYEADQPYAVRSARRLDRARQLLAELGSTPADEQALMTILSDHENGQDAICRHPADGDGTKTVFWCLADVTGRRIRYGPGNPCRSRAQSYTFPVSG